MLLYGTEDLRERRDARRLLALAARETWGWQTLPPIVTQPLGKPCFSGLSGREFNLSHSGALALCGLDDAPVGVDIQVVRDWRDGLPRRVCAQEELDWLSRQPDPGRAFALLWALKESRVKESGQGIRSPLRQVAVPLPEHWSEPVQLDGLWFCTYQGENWAAAACGHSLPPASIRFLSLL